MTSHFAAETILYCIPYHIILYYIPYIWEAGEDINHDYHLWNSIIELKDTTHQEIMNEICFATGFVKIYCRSGNFHVLQFLQICDFGSFRKFWFSRIFNS